MLVNKPIKECILKTLSGCFGSRASPFAQTIIGTEEEEDGCMLPARSEVRGEDKGLWV